MNYDKYLKDARETGVPKMIFRSVSNDSNNPGKLVLIMLKFYPNGEIIKYTFHDLDNPFNDIYNIEGCLNKMHFNLRHGGDQLTGLLTKTIVRQADPVPKDISVRRIEDVFNNHFINVNDEDGNTLLKIRNGKIFVNKEAL